MAVYRYSAINSKREEYTEKGTIVATSEDDARKKLKAFNFDEIRLKKVGGVAGLLGKFTADIK